MNDLFETLVAWRREGRSSALATIISAHGSIPSHRSARMLVAEDGAQAGTIGGGCVEADVFQAAKEVIESGAPRLLTFNLNGDPKYDAGLVCGGTLQVYVEPIMPDPVLYVFGAGHVGHALYRAAAPAGFSVVAIDDRELYANAERFPDAAEVVVGELPDVLARLSPRPGSFIVICTRGHKGDLAVLRWAVRTPARYVGLLGSRRKVIGFRRSLEEEGVPPALLQRLHAPIGLELGAATPGEIAISIAAELIAERRGSAARLAHRRDSLPAPGPGPKVLPPPEARPQA